MNTIRKMVGRRGSRAVRSFSLHSRLVNNRPRIIDDRLKQLQPAHVKSSKIPVAKTANDDLKKLIQERRKAAANSANQNHDIEIYVAPK